MRRIGLAVVLTLSLVLAPLAAEAQQTGRFTSALIGTPRSSEIPLIPPTARREPHDCVTAAGRNPALANSPRAHAPAVVANGVLRRSAVIRPTVHNHLHARHTRE
jgi:hypothetical protein